MALETSLIRTATFRRLCFRENIDLPDIEFLILLAREGGEFTFIPDYVTEIRYHPESTTGRGFRSYLELADLLAPLSVSPEVEPLWGSGKGLHPNERSRYRSYSAGLPG